MRILPHKLKPKKGISHSLHIGFNAVLPVVIFILIRVGLVQLAAVMVLLTKWRIFSVRPRYWPAIIRANAVDIIVGLSFVVFMAQSSSASVQLAWAFSYALWLIFLKPGSSIFKTSVQAGVAQLLGLMAVYLAWAGAPLYVLVVLTWLVCYSAARHFFTSFEEPYTPLFAHMWGYFSAGLAWLLGHWLLFYGIVSQPMILLTVIGYSLASLYYLEHKDRLSATIRANIMVMMIAVITIVLVFSDWGDKAV